MRLHSSPPPHHSGSKNHVLIILGKCFVDKEKGKYNMFVVCIIIYYSVWESERNLFAECCAG